MTSPYQSTLDENDLELAQSACDGSIAALSDLLERHRPLLFFLYYSWTGSEVLSNAMIESLYYRLTLRLRSRPPHSAVRIWMYSLAIQHLLESDPGPLEQLLSYPKARYRWIGHQADASPDQCRLRQTTPQDCRMALIVSLKRPLRTAFILDSLLRLKPVLGARLAATPAKIYRGRATGANEYLTCSILSSHPLGRSLCQFCAGDFNLSKTSQEDILFDSPSVDGILIPTIADWQKPASSPMESTITWLKRSIIAPPSNGAAIVQLIRQIPDNNRPV